MNIQPIYNVAELCYQQGITNVIISPGSRSAPLTLAFSRHPEITMRVVPDERSAAFIALGMAQIIGKPVILICTSGSAVYNYAPAIAEAYFSRVPLLVFSADRPPEWWGQEDGQTIYQQGIFGKHVALSRTIPVDLSHKDARWHLYRTVTEAIHTSIADSRPAHVNFPFREPFYPASDDPVFFESEYNSVQFAPPGKSIPNHIYQQLIGEWPTYGRKLLVSGQNHLPEDVLANLNEYLNRHSIPVVADITANMHSVDNHISGCDAIVNPSRSDLENFMPDLLITVGGAILSKNLKKFLRAYPPKAHWHFTEYHELIDTFQNVSVNVHADNDALIQLLASAPESDDFTKQKQANYLQLWRYESQNYTQKLVDLFEEQLPLGEFEMVYNTIKLLPDSCNVHLANSMAVRYANYCNTSESGKDIKFFSNRGACGIDGCSSTAAGSAIADSNRLNILITGDMAFLYDRNAWWHNYPLNNLRIIVLNNHGGGIFRLIPGPSSQPELEPIFETQQPLKAKLTAEEFGFEYALCDNRIKMENLLEDFFITDSRPKMIEIETKGIDNQSVMSLFRKTFPV